MLSSFSKDSSSQGLSAPFAHSLSLGYQVFARWTQVYINSAYGYNLNSFFFPRIHVNSHTISHFNNFPPWAGTHCHIWISGWRQYMSIPDHHSGEGSSLWMGRRPYRQLAVCREHHGSFSASLRENQQRRDLLALESSALFPEPPNHLLVSLWGLWPSCSPRAGGSCFLWALKSGTQPWAEKALVTPNLSLAIPRQWRQNRKDKLLRFLGGAEDTRGRWSLHSFQADNHEF